MSPERILRLLEEQMAKIERLEAQVTALTRERNDWQFQAERDGPLVAQFRKELQECRGRTG